MISSVHVVDIGAWSGLAMLGKTVRPSLVPGLRHADFAIAAPFSKSLRPSPQPGRIGLVAFWDDEDALDRFLASHPMAARLSGGWQVRLEPLRLWGTWPGAPDDLPRTRDVEHQGPVAALTLGRLRLSQTLRFLRTSAKAQGAALSSTGLVWATGFARPPFVATLSLSESTDALTRYAYGHGGAHEQAIHADDSRPFHHQSAFIRFRPLDSQGSLEGRNPLTESWLAPA